MKWRGREVALGDFRIQIDPLVLFMRVLLRRKTLLAVVATIGCILTVWTYLSAPKRYTSRATILIRYENYDESYLQKLLNVLVGYLGSDSEMMLIINELDLYGEMRATLPYELARRQIRRDLSVRNQPRSIEIGFTSAERDQAQRVAAFVTERLLAKMAEMNESPFDRELEGLARSLTELEGRKRTADNKLYEFRAAHPDIANKMAEFLPANSPLGAADAEIRRAEADLIAARTGRPLDIGARAPRNTEATQKLRELDTELARLRMRYTEDHPDVQRAREAVSAQRAKVREEQALLDGDLSRGQDPEEARRTRIARAEAHLRELLRDKIELEKKAIRTPALQREWAELSLESQTMSLELTQALQKREQVRRDRIAAANRFQENFQLVDAARVPELPSEPSRTEFAMTGMGLTAAVGLLLAMIIEAVRQTFVDPSELEDQTGVQVVAVLPNVRHREVRS